MTDPLPFVVVDKRRCWWIEHWAGEVPNSVFMSDDHVLFYVEGLPAFHCCSGWCSNTGAASGMYSARGHGSLVVTDAGFYYYPDELKFISWNDSSHVIFTTSQFYCPGALEVRVITHEKTNDNLYVTWDVAFIKTPWVPEIIQLIENKRKAVMETTAYKETLKYSLLAAC